MTAQHTPGPWSTIREVDSLITITAPNGWGLAEVVAEDPFGQITPDVAEANARLIAAAPDMFKALMAETDYEALAIHVAGAAWFAASDICDRYPVLHQDLSGAEALRILRGYAADLRLLTIAKARGQAVQP